MFISCPSIYCSYQCLPLASFLKIGPHMRKMLGSPVVEGRIVYSLSIVCSIFVLSHCSRCHPPSSMFFYFTLYPYICPPFTMDFLSWLHWSRQLWTVSLWHSNLQSFPSGSKPIRTSPPKYFRDHLFGDRCATKTIEEMVEVSIRRVSHFSFSNMPVNSTRQFWTDIEVFCRSWEFLGHATFSCGRHLQSVEVCWWSLHLGICNRAARWIFHPYSRTAPP